MWLTCQKMESDPIPEGTGRQGIVDTICAINNLAQAVSLGSRDGWLHTTLCLLNSIFIMCPALTYTISLCGWFYT